MENTYSDPPRRVDILAVIALALVILGFFWRMAFTNLILPRGDTFLYFYPLWTYRSAALAAGRLPVWNPDLFMGAPFLANSQTGVLYPFNWPLVGLSAPVAVKVAIIGHVIWAGVGTYLLGRSVLRLSPLGALTAAITFALGGYLTAQVEHINQLQGLAWLPWMFYLWSLAVTGKRWAAPLLALALGVCLLAGHTQSVFICGVALGAWAVWHTLGAWFGRHGSSPERRLRKFVWPVGMLALASLLALGLAAAQILPTLELTRYSNRGGGLSFLDAVSFSMRPELLGRGLLPRFDGTSLFTEYIAYPGVIALGLVIWGLWAGRHRWHVLGLAGLAALGLFFAFGAYNPVYWGLVRFMPGFDLFRAPARWLVLWALGVALLSGIGLDALSSAGWPGLVRARRGWLLIAFPGLAVAGLAGLSFLTPLAPATLPGLQGPAPGEILLWSAALGVLISTGALAARSVRAQQTLPPALASLLAVELFLAGTSLPFNDLSAPNAWASQRPAVSTLKAANEGQIPAPRYLSMSDTLFDPGDLHELQAMYAPFLSAEALFDLIVATKQQEVLAPNLSLAWGIPAMDGFDGGILPTRDFTRFSALMIGVDEIAPDGRLREYLERVPDPYWLDMANVRWVITDKVYDAWFDGVYHDLQFSVALSARGTTIAEVVPRTPFTATTISLVGHLEDAENLQMGMQVGSIALYDRSGGLPLIQPILVGPAGSITTVDGSTAVEVGSYTPGSPDVMELRIPIRWGEPTYVERVEVSVVSSFPGTLVLRGASLIDERSMAFISASILGRDDVRLAYSGDVKIYEFGAVRPRAWLACGVETATTDEQAWAMLAQRPQRPVIVTGEEGALFPFSCNIDNPGEARILGYEPERVTVGVASSGEGAYLILTDAWYPGWEADIDGLPAQVLRANGLFRAVSIPSGEHIVTFTYRSQPLLVGAVISGVALLAVGAWAGLVILRSSPASPPETAVPD